MKNLIRKLSFVIIIIAKLTIFVGGLDVVGLDVVGFEVGLEDVALTVHISTLPKQ
jgi:hypothetical protein